MRKKEFLLGLRDGVPIGLGYLAVAFSLGIAAKQAGLSAGEGFVASLVTAASAGEYAVFVLIGASASYWEVLLMTLVANARYLLMSCSLSQKFRPEEKLRHRIFIGAYVTDELFGIHIGREGPVSPFYGYGAIAVAIPLWALGTALGIVAGNMLPARIVSALSVALYGMFIAIIIPPAKKNAVIAGLIVLSFAFSYLFSVIPGLQNISSGTRTIILTAVLSAGAAVLFPIMDDEGQKDANGGEC